MFGRSRQALEAILSAARDERRLQDLDERDLLLARAERLRAFWADPARAAAREALDAITRAA